MQNLNCNQVSALISFFIENKLSKKIMQSVEYHLNICCECRNKYMKMQNLYKNYFDFNNDIFSDCTNQLIGLNDNLVKHKDYKIFLDNLSAYIDNELDINENLKIKKTMIVNPDARRELENLINFRQMLNDAFNKTKSTMKTDYSELTLQKIYHSISEDTNEYNTFLIIFSGTVCTILLVILYGFIIN